MHKIIDHNIPLCEQITLPEGRRYVTPQGNVYPSVTTVLGIMGKEKLVEWRAKVGQEFADAFSKQAAERGTRIHTMCEDYIRGKPVKYDPFRSDEIDMFKNMKTHLDNFEEVHALETRMWSDQLKVAGTVDCIAIINGSFHIVDFKTSGRFKTREDIPSYFMQCAAYSLMFYERVGIIVPNMSILITTQDDGVLVYNEPVRPWIEKFRSLRKEFDEVT